MKLDELQKRAMELPDSDRAGLADALLGSLPPGGSSSSVSRSSREIPSALATPFQEESRSAGKFNLAIGLIFLAWTACDLMAGFDGWSSYTDISFGLLAIVFIVYGASQIKAAGGA